MAEVTYKGKSFEVDEDGFLLRFDDWSTEWVEFVKESEGIADITPDHQKIIDFLQDYYKKNGIAPMVRILSKNTGFKLKEIYELFPSGPGKGACKMAGHCSLKGRELVLPPFSFAWPQGGFRPDAERAGTSFPPFPAFGGTPGQFGRAGCGLRTAKRGCRRGRLAGINVPCRPPRRRTGCSTPLRGTGRSTPWRC